jgi:hypothetical protein
MKARNYGIRTFLAIMIFYFKMRLLYIQPHNLK